MPIKGRIEMLSTGLRTPMGIKISGADVKTIETDRVAHRIPAAGGQGHPQCLRRTDRQRLFSRFRLAPGGIGPLRPEHRRGAGRDQNAIGGENVTTTVEGRERYTVNVRYQRDFRSDFSALERILVPAADGKRQIPLGQLASIKTASGPAMIRDEDGLLTGYVYIDIAGRDPNGYVEEAARLLKDKVKLPPGYAISWSGQYEAAISG